MQAYLTELLTAKAWVVVAATMTTVNVVRNVFFIVPASSVSNLLGGVCSPFDEANMTESSAPRCSGRHRSMKFLKITGRGDLQPAGSICSACALKYDATPGGSLARRFSPVCWDMLTAA